MRSVRPAVPVLAGLGVAVVAVAMSLPARDAHGAGAAARVAHGPGARHAVISAKRPLVVASTKRAASWATALPPVDVQSRNTGRSAKVRLYGDDGSLDPEAVRTFTRAVATEGNDETTEPLPSRLVQLVARAAYHFGGKRVLVVSATRKGSHGKHGAGEAIDFALEGVRAPMLAAWLRTTPRAGVGIYTHPRTQYVHLDVREQSFHWLDGSPPGVSWRERRLPDPKQAKRDDAWTEAADLPETAALVR